jgi:hypothetical protein
MARGQVENGRKQMQDQRPTKIQDARKKGKEKKQKEKQSGG